MFESYIRGVFYYNYSSCHQLHTVALSFLPYAAGKQQLEGKMPKIGHFHFTNRSQRDENICHGRFQKTRYNVPGLFCARKWTWGDGVSGPFTRLINFVSILNMFNALDIKWRIDN